MVGKINSFGKFLLVLTLIFSFGFVSAASTLDDLHLNLQVTDAQGKVMTGSYDFKFDITTDSGCSNVVYTKSENLATDARGIISYYLDATTLSYDEQYYLCYYRNAVLIESMQIAKSPYAFRAKYVNVSGIEVDSNLDLGNFNFSANYLFGDGSGLTNLNISSLNISSLVPYLGATKNVNLGNFSIYAKNLLPDENGNLLFGSQNTLLNTTSSFGDGSGGLASGVGNSFFGTLSGSDSIGNYNSFFGGVSGLSNRGDYVFGMGHNSAKENKGSKVIAIGSYAGVNNSGDNTIFIGERVGTNNVVSNRLMIDIENTQTPLIDGDFAGNVLTVNGDLNVTGSIYGFSGGTGNWNKSGNDLYYNLGSVGIGISSPGKKLDVNGTARADELNIKNARMFIDEEGDMVFRI